MVYFKYVLKIFYRKRFSLYLKEKYTRLSYVRMTKFFLQSTEGDLIYRFPVPVENLITGLKYCSILSRILFNKDPDSKDNESTKRTFYFVIKFHSQSRRNK